MLAVDGCELKTSPIVVGNLVTHKYKGRLWISTDGNDVPNGGAIQWRSGEIGLVLRVDIMGDTLDIDMFIGVMIPIGIGYCLRSDVNMI